MKRQMVFCHRSCGHPDLCNSRDFLCRPALRRLPMLSPEPGMKYAFLISEFRAADQAHHSQRL
jgi:hypothetical protein